MHVIVYMCVHACVRTHVCALLADGRKDVYLCLSRWHKYVAALCYSILPNARNSGFSAAPVAVAAEILRGLHAKTSCNFQLVQTQA